MNKLIMFYIVNKINCGGSSNYYSLLNSIITYSYNVRGWMTGITNNHYSENISYDGLYNGNIASIENLYTKDIPSVKYTYTYDMLNRLTQAASSMDNACTETASYDKNGNFKSFN